MNVGLVKGFVVGLIPAPGLSSGIKAVYSITRSGFVSPFHTIQPAFYSVVPPAFHFVLPLSLLLAIGMSLFRNIAEPIEYENVLVSFTLLLIMGEVTFKQMHTNHLIWFYPLFALIFTATDTRSAHH